MSAPRDPDNLGPLDLLDAGDGSLGRRYREIYHGPECVNMPPWEKHAYAWRKALTEMRDGHKTGMP